MLDLKIIRAVVYEIEAEARSHPRKLAFMAYSDLLNDFNMLNRRNFKLLRRFDRQFRERNLSYWRGTEFVKRLEFFRKGETITFLLKENPPVAPTPPPAPAQILPQSPVTLSPAAPATAAPVAAVRSEPTKPPPVITEHTAHQKSETRPEPQPVPILTAKTSEAIEIPLESETPEAPDARALLKSGTIRISEIPSGIRLYPHQVEAMARLQAAIIDSGATTFSGLLVLPTGGGKTLTAAHWVAQNVLDKGKKVLWIAHRHELLEQALRTFAHKLAFHDIFTERTRFNYRLLSGIHDRPASISALDDLIISSKDSLSAGIDHLLRNWLPFCNNELFLVIDEAHHATAKSYCALIDRLKQHVPALRLLGLTATPFRTAAREHGLLKNVFPDDIVYKQDLRSLIRIGILSEPHFEEAATGRKMIEEFELSEEQVRELNTRFGDFNAILGERISKSIATNTKRNAAIVNRYLQHRSRYQPTIVFALNVDNAIALNALFREAGVRSDYVVSTLRDPLTGITRSGLENGARVEAFRAGELEVLINVNILTEGTDLPNVQSVFLTRPTISAILMTQMIGRGLRGPRAGGTKEAYIVSFVDDWQHRVAWVNPEKLFIEENVDFCTPDGNAGTQLLRLVAISKMEEFAIMNNQLINPEHREELEKLQFISRIPVGIYQFKFLNGQDETQAERACEVLVYDNVHEAYGNLLEALPDLFSRHNLQQLRSLTEEQLIALSALAEESYFTDTHRYPAYQIQDIKDLLQYFAVQGEIPPFIRLNDREKYDVDHIAARIIGERLDDLEQVALINAAWESNAVEWQAFFNFDKKSFLTEIMNAKKRRLFPELYE